MIEIRTINQTLANTSLMTNKMSQKVGGAFLNKSNNGSTKTKANEKQGKSGGVSFLSLEMTHKLHLNETKVITC